MGEFIGYARCSTILRDLTAPREILPARGVPDDRIHLDKGYTTGKYTIPELVNVFLVGRAAVRRGLDRAPSRLDEKLEHVEARVA
ncbi:hypothetical protein GCM10009850_114820 [Nonomuraea monospora]|uniref:Resolvase/invertase-type recombinase catalytic domain-containing protein n=1 Tax=Nonomuraea monospora TaxID=568818 RepID=A0ABN3D2G7_9ACTN